MPRWTWTLGLLLVAHSAAVLASAPITGSHEAEPIFTRQRTFAIPFRLERPEITSQAAAEVQLHVSADQGMTWRPQATISPQEDRFTFEAPRDGEYWFFVRTRGEVGGLYPEHPPLPELRVVVDTMSPSIELSGERQPTGELSIRWRVVDRHLVPEGLKIEYQPVGATDGWRPVSIPRQRLIGTGRVLQGETTWLPKDAPSAISLRAEAIDRAGNSAVSQIRIERLGQSTANAPPVSAPTPSGNNTATTQRSADRAWPSQPTNQVPGTGRYGNAEELLPPPMSQRFPGSGPTNNEPYADRRNPLSAQVVRYPDAALSTAPEEIPLGTPSESPGPRWPDRFDVQSGDSYSSDLADAEVLPGAVTRPDREYRPPRGSGRVVNDGAQQGLDQIPIGQRSRIVNSRRFELSSTKSTRSDPRAWARSSFGAPATVAVRGKATVKMPTGKAPCS